MRKTALILTALALLTLVSANLPGDTDKSLAKVNQYKGIYLFIESEPTNQYIVISEYVLKFDETKKRARFNEVRDNLINDVLKSSPEANGVIIKYNNEFQDLVDVIKFK